MISARLKKTYPAGRESRAFTLDVQLEAAAGVSVLFGPSGSGPSAAKAGKASSSPVGQR